MSHSHFKQFLRIYGFWEARALWEGGRDAHPGIKSPPEQYWDKILFGFTWGVSWVGTIEVADVREAHMARRWSTKWTLVISVKI